MRRAVAEGLKRIYDLSQQFVPVNHGDLKSTGYLYKVWDDEKHRRPEGGGESVVGAGNRWQQTGAVTYGDPNRKHSITGSPIDYAVPVHEKIHVKHKVGRALYLKTAVIDASVDLLALMGKEAAKELMSYFAGDKVTGKFGRHVQTIEGGRNPRYVTRFKHEQMEVLGASLYKGMTLSGLPDWSGGWNQFTSMSEDIMDKAEIVLSGEEQEYMHEKSVSKYMGYGQGPSSGGRLGRSKPAKRNVGTVVDSIGRRVRTPMAAIPEGGDEWWFAWVRFAKIAGLDVEKARRRSRWAPPVRTPKED